MSHEQHDSTVKEPPLLPQPTVASMVASIVASPRPLGWDRKSNSSYYAPRYGNEIKLAVDKQIAERRDIIYRYDTWCEGGKATMNKSTLYQRIYQSIRYLCERMDGGDSKVAPGTYNKWWREVHVERRKSVGVVIFYVVNDNIPTLEAEHVKPRAEMPVWKQALEDWLEDSDDQTPFNRERLALTPEEVAALKGEFVGLTSVAASITSTYIRVIKL